jgi:hypothetical protein
MVCKPKENGGLGVVNFQKKNNALLLKHLDKFYNKSDTPWVQLIWSSYYTNSVPHSARPCGSFWWRDIMHLSGSFTEVATIEPGMGDSFLFWSDKWKFMHSDQPLASRFPRLFSFVLDKEMSAADVFSTEDFSQLFYRPLSAEAFQEYCQVQQGLITEPLSGRPDIWKYAWGEKYHPSKFYAHLHADMVVPAVFRWLWKSACMMKTKMFAWLLLNDRLNTRDLLVRRNWTVSDDRHCVLCPTHTYEDRLHLFFTCNFSHRIWNYLQIDWSRGADLQTAVAEARRGFAKPFFMEVMITACWHIWKQRNGRIFENERPTFARWKCNFVHDITLLQHRIKVKHRDSLLTWVHSLP